jgi:pSer/pThr/pTyr-binding forkhead associated (FHA) protein
LDNPDEQHADMSAERQTHQTTVHLHAIVAPGPREHWLFPASTAAIRIGRAPESDLILADPSVSRTHARIVVEPGECRIEDSGSRLGVYVNAEKIDTPRVLANGDYIGLGGVLLRFDADTAGSAAHPAAIAGMVSIADAATPKQTRRQVALSAGAHAIGRNARCDIVLENLELAAVEAILSIEPDAWRMAPIYGAAGVMVDGKRLTGPMRLDDSARIQIGKQELRLRRPPPQRGEQGETAARGVAAGATTPAGPTIAVHSDPGEQVAEPEFALICVSAEGRGMRYPLRHAVISVGSAADCQMRISSLPSRALTLTQGQARYRVDLIDPTVPVRVSAARHPPCDLRKGDLIEIGGIVFRLIRRREPFTSAYDPAEFDSPGASLASRMAWQRMWKRWRGK